VIYEPSDKIRGLPKMPVRKRVYLQDVRYGKLKFYYNTSRNKLTQVASYRI
jgi:hypothetical protein